MTTCGDETGVGAPVGRGALRVWASTGLSALCALVPLFRFNPEFAGSAAGWLGLGALCVLSTWLAMVVGIAFRGGPGASAVRRVGRLWLALLLALVGDIVAGARGAALAPVCFVAVAMVPLARRSAREPGGAARTALAAAVTSALLLLALPNPRPATPQLIVIGIDGATWNIVDDLRGEGRLPAFERLIASGTRGELDTLEPSISPSLWTSIATGVSSEVHGVWDFWASSHHVAAKRVWEIADDAGLKSGVLGYLVTWPPRKKVGFLVPGWLAQGDETVPADLSFLRQLEDLEHSTSGLGRFDRLRVLFSCLRRGATLSTLRGVLAAMTWPERAGEDPRRRDLRRRRASTALWADVFCHFLGEFGPHLGIFYQHHVDAVQHLNFAEYRSGPSKPAGGRGESYADAIPQIYEAMDRAIDRIGSCASPEATLLVLSDHGQRLGHISRRPMRLIKTTTLLDMLGLEGTVHATNIGDQVFLRSPLGESAVAAAVDALRAVSIVRTGAAVFRIEGHGEDGALLTLRRGIRSDEPIRVGGREVPLSAIVDRSGRFSGVHTDEALLLMAGPDIARGQKLVGGSLLDVAPTILAFLGLPVARDMEGRVLDELLRPGARADFSVRYVETYGAPEGFAPAAGERDDLDEATRRKLRSLGYLR